MTHQTNEELRDQLDRKFNKYFEHYEDVEQSHIDKMVNEILSLIPQPEQLEVEIQECDGVFRVVFIPNTSYETTLNDSKSKQEALDFCKRFNLKVINEKEKI